MDLTNYLAGFCQGITRVLISFPFDVVKVKMQKNNTNFLRTLKYCYINDKQIFYRGVSLPLVSVSLERAFSYKLYEYFNSKNYNPYLSGFISSIIFSPLCVPVQYLSSNITHYQIKNYGSYIKSEIKLGNVFKGYKLEVSKNMLASTLYLGTYGNMRNKFSNNFSGTCLSAITSSLVSWSVIFPLDTIRTEYQTNNSKSYLLTIRNKINNHGIKSLYNGITPVFIRSIPSSVLGMLVYENIRKYFSETK